MTSIASGHSFAEQDEEDQLPLTQEEIDALVDSGQMPEYIAEILSDRLNSLLN